MALTTGFGKLALFKNIPEQHIIESFNVNTISVLRLIRRFCPTLEAKDDFYCGVMGSIAGWISSLFFAVFGATKATLKIIIESVNVELLKANTTNQILNVSPRMIAGTGFYAGKTDFEALHDLSNEIIHHLENKEDVFIPKYNEVYKFVLQRYHDDFRKEGAHSYEHKMNRINQQ